MEDAADHAAHSGASGLAAPGPQRFREETPLFADDRALMFFPQRRRIILGDDVDEISAIVERRRRSTARGAEFMIDDGPGRINAFPAGQLRTPRQIDVFARVEEVFVE